MAESPAPSSTSPESGSFGDLAPVPVDNQLAWMIVAVPVLWAAIDTVLLLAKIPFPMGRHAQGAAGGTLALVFLDARRLRANGYPVRPWWALLLVPIYLLHRSRRTRQSFVIPIAGLAALIVSIVVAVGADSALGQVTLDMPRVQQAISDQLDDTSTTVTCPKKDTYWVHDTFACTVNDSTGTQQEIVTLQDHSGTVTWEPASTG